MTATSLIYTGAIGDRAVRFHLPPVEAPDLPWVNVPDLLQFIAPDPAATRAIKGFLARHRGKTREVGPPGGPYAVLAPHWLAREILSHAARAGWCERQVYREFRQEAHTAFERLIESIPAAKRIAYAKGAQEHLRERVEG